MNPGLLRYSSISFALLLLSACSQEEPADGSQLPDGAYPMEFIAGFGEAESQSRVSETADGMGSTWTEGDKIKVHVSNGGKNMETTCTLNGNGNITAYDPQLYWTSTESASVTAWYSNITGQSTVTDDNVVSLADQSSSLAYVLKASATNDFGSQIQLGFTHQLAKIRVKISGIKASEVTSVEINNYTSCAIADGTVTGVDKGYITMHKNGEYYEANVVPEPIDTDNFIRLNGSTEVALTDMVPTLSAGHVYTININTREPGTYDLSDGDTDIRIDQDGEYIITGTGAKTIHISAENAIVTLRDVNLLDPQHDDIPIEIENNGTTKIIFEGENKITCSDGVMIRVGGGFYKANLILEGKNNSSLVCDIPDKNYTTWESDAIIGGGEWTPVGNIEIRNINLTINYSSSIHRYGAIIGSGDGPISSGDKIGNISISNTVLNVNWTGSGALLGAVIGSGRASLCGDISITNSELNIRAGLLNGAFIGAGYAKGEEYMPDTDKSSCGDITISLKDGVSQDEFLSKLTSTGIYTPTGTNPTAITEPDKVGKGGTTATTTSTCGTVTWLP